MKFAHPEILWALFALAIPIIVHLFNFRRFKKVEFSNVAFLKEVKQETKSRTKIKHWLTLLSRLLAIAFLVFAFAQPFIPVGDKNNLTGENWVSVYLDNSFSMEAESSEGPLLAVSKNKAEEIVNRYSPTDHFQILTNDFEGRHQRWYSKEEALELIQEIDITSTAKNISEVFSRQKDLISRTTEASVVSFILSDLQKSTHDIETTAVDSTFQIRFVPTQAANSTNVYIDSMWFSTPVRVLNQREQLHVRIRHSSKEKISDIPIKLRINGSQKALGSFEINPDSYTDTVLYYTNSEPGIMHAELEIIDSPVSFDDQYFFGYEVAENVSILRVKGIDASNEIPKVYDNDPYYEMSSMNESNINFGDFASFQMIVLDQVRNLSSGLISECEKFVRSGGTLVIIPSQNSSTSDLNELMLSVDGDIFSNDMVGQTKVSGLNMEHFIYNGIFEDPKARMDLPKINRYKKMEIVSRSKGETLMFVQNGDPFLRVYQHGSGRVYCCATSLQSEQSNFAQHAIFVPTMLRVAEFSQPSTPLEYTIGGTEVISLRAPKLGTDQVYKMKAVSGQSEFIPEHRQTGINTDFFVHDQIDRAENYSLNIDEASIFPISLNYNRIESELSSFTPESFLEKAANLGWTNIDILKANSDQLGKEVLELDEGRSLWKIFIMLALGMLALEILFIKLL